MPSSPWMDESGLFSDLDLPLVRAAFSEGCHATLLSVANECDKIVTNSRQETLVLVSNGYKSLILLVGVRGFEPPAPASRTQGATGLISGHRGKRPNNAIADSVRQQALALVKECYPDFSPTFAHEKLMELPSFIEDYNRRFAVEPQHPEDAHREVLHSADELKLILCLHHTRKLTKNLSLQYDNTEYQLQGYGKGYRLRGAAVTICEAFDGAVTLLHKGHSLAFHTLQQGEKPISLADEKSLHAQVDHAQQKQQQKPNWKPAADHPWRHSQIGACSAATL